MEAHPVADLAGHPQHRLADRGDGDRHHRQAGRLGREIRGHQCELIVLALVIELPAGLPAMPDGAQGLDVIAQPRRRRAPRYSEPALVVAFDLAAQPEDEAPVRIRLEIPSLARHDGRAARERHGDRRRQLDPFGRQRRKGERGEDVVPQLDRHQRIEAGALGRHGKRRRVAPVLHRQHREDAHFFPSPNSRSDAGRCRSDRRSHMGTGKAPMASGRISG